MFVLMTVDDLERVLDVNVLQSNESLAKKQQEAAAWMAANPSWTKEQADLEVFKTTALTTVFSFRADDLKSRSGTPHTRKRIWLGGANNYSNGGTPEELRQAGGYDAASKSFKRLTVVQDGPFRVSTPPNRCVPDILTAIKAAVKAMRAYFPAIQSIEFTGQFSITDIGTMSHPDQFDELKSLSHCALSKRLWPYFDRYNVYKSIGFEFPALTFVMIQHWHAQSVVNMFAFLQLNPDYPQRDDRTPNPDWWTRFINTNQVIYPGRQIKDINLSFRGDLVAISNNRAREVSLFGPGAKRGRTGALLNQSTGVDYEHYWNLKKDTTRLIMRVPSSDRACESSYYVAYEYDRYATRNTVSVCQSFDTDGRLAQIDALVPLDMELAARDAEFESVFGFNWDDSDESRRGAFKALEVQGEHVWTKANCKRTIRHAIHAAVKFMRIYFPCVNSISYRDFWLPGVHYLRAPIAAPVQDMRVLARMTTLEEMKEKVEEIYWWKYTYYQSLGFKFDRLNDKRVKEWQEHVARRLLAELTPEKVASVERKSPGDAMQWYKEYVNLEEYRKPDLQKYGFLEPRINTWFEGDLLAIARLYDQQDAAAAARAAAAAQK
jgi:hypothetical protein